MIRIALRLSLPRLGALPLASPPAFLDRSAMATSVSTTPLDFEKHQIKRGHTTFDAYVVGEKGAPGVVVLQEWWGVEYEVKNHALAIAKKGFRSLIPDLYRGKIGLDAAEAQHLMENLDWKGAVEDVAESVKWLKEDGSPKVGVTGYCMGGALSIACAVLVPGVDAVISFYGVPSPDLADVSTVKVPVQAHFGEKDGFVGFSDVTAAKSLEEKLKSAGVDHEVYIYPNVGHAFMNCSLEALQRGAMMKFEPYNAPATELAWSRFEAWFNKYLK